METFIDDLHASIQAVYDTLVQMIDHYPEGILKEGLLRYKCILIKHTSFDKEVVEETCLETHKNVPFKKIAMRMSYNSFKNILTKNSWSDTVAQWKHALKDPKPCLTQQTSVLLMYYFPNESTPNHHRVFLSIEAYLKHFCQWMSTTLLEEIKQECQNAYYAHKDIPRTKIREDIATMDRLLVQLGQSIKKEIEPILMFLETVSFEELYQSLYDELHSHPSQGGFSRTTLRKKAMDAYNFNVKYRLSLFGIIQSEYRSLSLYASKERPILTALAMPINVLKIMNTTIVSTVYTSIVLPLKLTLMIPLLPRLAYKPMDFIRTLVA